MESATHLTRTCLLALVLLLVACAPGFPGPKRGAATPDMYAIETFAVPRAGYGVEAYPTPQAIGGGEAYGAWAEDYSVSVDTKDDLLAALVRARAGDVIYVADDAEIDLTGVWDTPIPAGVTLASGRGRYGAPGALLYTTANANRGLFEVRGNGVRITGLRLRGPSTVEKPGGCPLNARGVTIRASKGQPTTPTVEIVNNELWGWPNAAISIVRVSDVHIHHNYIHHNRRVVTSVAEDPMHGCADGAYGLGYGVNVSGGHVFIDANRFDYNRHDIASDGSPNSGYTARYNLVLAHGTSHSFDIHGYGEQRSIGDDPPYEAGDKLVIHNNTFLQAANPAIVIRGIPKTGAWIYRNQFAGQEDSIVQRNVDQTGRKYHPPQTVNMHVDDNQYSVELDPVRYLP